MEKIDFIIPWVDGADEKWIEEKRKYVTINDDQEEKKRYRDWDNLQYWFRGVEKFAPWVNKVHFVTWGHIPKWLNVNHPKLNIVNHADYIPEKYLPVFSSHPIELNFHRIEGLAEKFVYFNDDTFLTDLTKPADFFSNGLPNSMVVLCPNICRMDSFSKAITNDLAIINKHFGKTDILKNKNKILSIKNGWRVIMSVMMFPYLGYTGLITTHLPNAYLKSTFKEIWEKEPEILDVTCNHRIRNILDVNQYLMKYWQIASGKFNPVNEEKIGKYFQIGRDDKLIEKNIKEQRYKMICLNDVDDSVDFEVEKNFIKRVFDTIFLEKSKFEK